MNSDLKPEYDESGNLLRFTPRSRFAWREFRRSYNSFAALSREVTRDMYRYGVWFAQQIDRVRKMQPDQAAQKQTQVAGKTEVKTGE